MIVIKRDGSKQLADRDRIVTAATLALKDAGYRDDKFVSELADRVMHKLTEPETHIEKVQEHVENDLMRSRYKDAARGYIEYRLTRDVARESCSKLNKDIQGLVKQTNTLLLNENANKDGKIIPTQRDLLAGIVSKHYALQNYLPKNIARAHERGDIHYHDLDYAPFFPSFNCMLIDLRNMLENGFSLGNASIDTPKSITTATAVTAQIIAQVASHIYGGNTINGIDTILEKYVTMTYNKHYQNAYNFAIKLGIMDEDAIAKEAMRLTEKTTHDAFQALEYEVNTLHCANGQTPFCTFGFGLGTSWEARLIQKSLLEVRKAGIGKDGNTAVFPKLVFAIKDGVNHKPSDVNYDIKQIAVDCATKRMYPDILNYERLVETTGSFKFPMGCRSFLSKWENEQGEEIHDGRNNLGVVSLNLPRIALKSKSEKDFFKKLDKMITLGGEALMTRIARLEHVQAKVAPILYTEGACGVRLKPDDYVIDIFKNGRASISLGYIGIHETINALVNKHIFESCEAQELSVRIITRLRDACDKLKDETGFAFGLYSTPSENLCDRFCRLDTKEFGIIDGVTDKGYYTNSFHLDVQHKVTPFEKIDFEKPYPALANGGFISYAEFPTMRNNKPALEAVWDYAFEHIPYFGTNTPVDQCHSCGFEGEFDATSKGFECPQCGNRDEDTISVVRRVCGYLGEANARPFVEGKQNEVLKRVKHC